MAIARESLKIGERGNGFVLLIDGDELTSPAGNPIVLQSRRLMRVLAAELATHEDIDAARLGIYCLASTEVDFIRKGKIIPLESVAKIVLMDPALQASPAAEIDVLSPCREILDAYLQSLGRYHPEIPDLAENRLEEWVQTLAAADKQNLEGILSAAAGLYAGMRPAEHAVLINAGKVHRSFILGLMLVQEKASPAEYAAAVMASLKINPLAWQNIGTDQFRAAYEEVRLQADSMRLYLQES
jgi:chaperone required for assembly of F1-ATPase